MQCRRPVSSIGDQELDSAVVSVLALNRRIGSAAVVTRLRGKGIFVQV